MLVRAVNTLVKFSFCTSGLATASLPSRSSGVPGQGTWETTHRARGINRDGVVDAYYDTALNINWLATWKLSGVALSLLAIVEFARPLGQPD